MHINLFAYLSNELVKCADFSLTEGTIVTIPHWNVELFLTLLN